MAQPEYWNHNAAYYPWVERHLRGRRRILDVGCGNGALAAVLETPERRILGIDPFPACIEAAKNRELGEDISFENCTLEELEAPWSLRPPCTIWTLREPWERRFLS